MGYMKRLFEDTYSEEMMLKKSIIKNYILKIEMFFEKNGDDVELIGFEKYEDSGLGDDQPSNA